MKKLLLFLLCSLSFLTFGNERQTDAILPRIDPEVSTQFYNILRDMDLLFKRERIAYWLTAGSLLGAVRHRGMIPWDDDIDLAFFEEDIAKVISLREKLKESGYELYVSPDYLKIYLTNGQPIFQDNGESYPWKYPFIDLFPMKRYGLRTSYASERLYSHLSDADWFSSEDLTFPLQKVPFGSLLAPIPKNPKDYLERVYGLDVWEIAYIEYSHATEKKCKKIKVKLVNKECAPDLSR